MNDSDDGDLWPARLAWLVDVAALVYSVIPPLILGRMKLPLAQELHQKALQTDANMNKGDWLAGLAGVVGITGVAFGTGGLTLKPLSCRKMSSIYSIDCERLTTLRTRSIGACTTLISFRYGH